MFCPSCGDCREITAENAILQHFKCAACGHVFNYRPLDRRPISLECEPEAVKEEEDVLSELR